MIISKVKGITRNIKDLFVVNEIYVFLTKKEKFLIFSLLICLLISSIAEIVGIASIIPLIEIIKDPMGIDNTLLTRYLNIINGLTGFRAVNIAVISSLLIVIFAYSARIFSQFFILYVSGELGIFLHNKALYNYLKLPYSKQVGEIANGLPYFLSRGITKVVSGIIFRYLTAISSLILFIFLSGGLLVAEPRITLLFISSIIVFYFLINIPFFNFLSKGSKKIYSYEKDHLESLGGLKWFNKQLKLYGIEDKYYFNLSNLHSKFRKLNTLNSFIGTYPRTLIELLLIFVIIIIISLNAQSNLTNFTPRIIFCLLIVQKLLPLFSTLYASFTNLIENKYALIDLLTYLRIPYSDSKTRVDTSSKEISSIKINNLYFKYPKQHRYIFSGVSLSLDINKYYFLKAPSGYGKSTLIDLMLGLQLPNKGTILYEGSGLSIDAAEIITGKLISYVPQVNFFNDGELRDILKSHHNNIEIKEKDIYKACKNAELGSLIDSQGKYLSIYCSNNLLNFSGGQRQRFSIAQALIHPTSKMLILDETFSNIDKQTCKKILNNIKNNYPHLGILIITHDNNIIPDYYQIINLENINKKL